jgi:choline dehydrogenase-like flavoprotein
MTGGAVENSQVYDVIVIGAGAAGCFAAKELTEGGCSVLLLDAGPEVETVRHFPPSPPPDRGLVDRVFLGLSGQHVQARCLPFNRTTHQFYVNDRENPYSTPKNKPFNWFRGRQVGGRLHTWGRMALRFSDWELKPSTRGARGTDWPISYEDLAPFYARVERFLGVHGTCERLPNLPDGEFIAPRSLTALEHYVRDRIVESWPTRRFIPARVVKHNPLRIPLPLVAAMETGRLTVRANAVVRSIRMDGGGATARGVSFVDRTTKRSIEAEGRVIVLCASAIESVRILLNSACERHPDGLGNSSGLLGRFVMDHVMVTAGGSVPEKLYLERGQEAGAAPEDPYDVASNYIYMPGFRNITEPCADYAGSYGVSGFVGRRSPTFFFLGLGDMVPHYDNRVSIDTSVRDAWGIPAAHVECVHHPNDLALIADMARTLGEMAAVSGLKVRFGLGHSRRGLSRALYGRWWDSVWTRYEAHHPGASIHELGGARMGEDPRQSVLNQFNQSWDVRNVFVTDGACFVSAGYQSTTLTIMALTVRACDFILSEHRKGNL